MKYYKVKSVEECEKHQDLFEEMYKYCDCVITGIPHPFIMCGICGPLNDKWTWNEGSFEEIEYNGCK